MEILGGVLSELFVYLVIEGIPTLLVKGFCWIFHISDNTTDASLTQSAVAANAHNRPRGAFSD